MTPECAATADTATHLPECHTRGCTVTYWPDLTAPRFIFQHGDNPESVTFVDAFFYGTRELAAAATREKVRAFTEACHRYEDGKVPA